MIKWISTLRKYRWLIAGALAAPLFVLILGKKFNFKPFPPNPFPSFRVELRSHGVQAHEITEQITAPTERAFNALPGLLSLESTSADHVAEFELIFNKSVRPNEAYLFIQEKIDGLKLSLPRSVTAIVAKQITDDERSDIHIEFTDEISIEEIRNRLVDYLPRITQSVPPLDTRTKIEIKFSIQKLFQNHLPLSQALGALKTRGILASIGTQNGIFVELGRYFSSIEEIQGILVGSSGHRPLRLTDVAEIKTLPAPKIKSINLWFDTDLINAAEIVDRLSGLNPVVSQPYQVQVREMLSEPIMGFIVLVILQIIFSYLIYRSTQMIIILLVFDGLVAIHYIFWTQMIRGFISIFDLTSLNYASSIGTVFLFILFARIRVMLTPSAHFKKTIQSPEQASLIALSELLPAFLTITLVFYISNLSVVGTDLNMPSQYIINSLAGYGMPIVLFLLVFIPTAADQRLISETKSARKIPLNWSINKQFTKIMLWMCGAAVLVAPILLYRLPIGIANLKDSKDTTTFLSHLGRFRGYDSSLRYLSPIDSKNENEMDKVEVITPYKSGKYTIYDFTVIGLGHLSQYGVSELKDSIREVQQGSSQGFYNDNNKIVPITLMKESLSPSEVPYIVLSGSDNKKPTVLRLLARSKIEDIPSLEYRNRLQTSELVRIKGSPNFKAPVPSDLVSSQMAEYFQTQISDFFWSQITNLMFIFLLLALYLNSFFRSILLLGFSAIPLSSFCLLQFVWPAPFDLDSLWILFTVPWLTLMLLIIVGRVIDTERWRGTDRDAAVMDTKEQFAPSAFLAILFLPTMIFVISLLSHIPIMSSVQLWKAGAFSAVIMAATLWLAIRHLFPLYYLEGEAFVENHLLRIYSFLQKTYSKGRKLGT